MNFPYFSFTALVLVCTCFLGTPGHTQAPSDDAQIRTMLENYIVGWREGDSDKLKEVFALQEGRVLWISNQSGKEVLTSMTFDKIIARDKKQPGYGLEWDVLGLDIIDGKLAVATVEISRKGGSYIDILTCHKINGSWKIVNKSFVVR